MQLPLCFTFLALANLVAAEEVRNDAQAECADGKCEPVLTTVYCTETETATMTTTMCETVYTTCVKMMTSIEISCPTVSPCPPPAEKSPCPQPEERTVAQPEGCKSGGCDRDEASSENMSVSGGEDMSVAGGYGEQQGGAEGMEDDADLKINSQFLPGCRRRCLRWGRGGFCRRWNRRCRCANWWGGRCRRWRPWGFGW